MAKARVHLKNGCDFTRDFLVKSTENHDEVTCKFCLRRVKAYKNTPIDENGRPTFVVKPEEGEPYSQFTCPVCKGVNRHGLIEPGTKSHRGAHCDCWEHGYFIARLK